MHAETPAKICRQIGHAGRKGSTNLGWEGMDKALASGNWDLISASGIPWSTGNAVPRAMARADMDAVKAEFVAATLSAVRVFGTNRA